MRNFLLRFFKRGKSIDGIWLTQPQIDVLRAVADGASLRSHRDLEGNKRYELLTLSGNKTAVLLEVVEALRRKRLIETNHKFPSATYLLTGHGSEVAGKLQKESANKPLTARKFAEHD